MTEVLDEYVRIFIHESELTGLKKPVRDFIENNKAIDFYPNGMDKDGKPIDKVKEFKRILKEMIALSKSKDPNREVGECVKYDILLELLHRMNINDIHKLGLEKLLKG